MGIVLPSTQIDSVYGNYTTDPDAPPDANAVHFFFFSYSSVMTRYSRSPAFLLQALTKIGGIIAFFKFSNILQYLHRKAFERKLDR